MLLHMGARDILKCEINILLFLHEGCVLLQSSNKRMLSTCFQMDFFMLQTDATWFCMEAAEEKEDLERTALSADILMIFIFLENFFFSGILFSFFCLFLSFGRITCWCIDFYLCSEFFHYFALFGGCPPMLSGKQKVL